MAVTRVFGMAGGLVSGLGARAQSPELGPPPAKEESQAEVPQERRYVMPDQAVFDQKGENKKGKPVELTEEKMPVEQLRASWFRRVQTTPGDFMRAKFACQAGHAEQQGTLEIKEGAK